jgi:hypothetical protein
MTNTTRLTVVEQEPSRGILQMFGKKKAPAPDTLSTGQAVLVIANECIERLRILPPEYQYKAWELVEDILKDAERKARAYAEADQ